MVSDDKQRFSISLTKEMTEKLDRYAKKMGVSRSMLCCLAIGQYVMTLDTAIEKFNESINE